MREGIRLAPLLATNNPKYKEKTIKAGSTFLYLPSLGPISLKGTAKKILIKVKAQSDSSQEVFEELNAFELLSFLPILLESF